MKKLEKLNNEGEPTGKIHLFTNEASKRMLAGKNSRWREVEEADDESPKKSKTKSDK